MVTGLPLLTPWAQRVSKWNFSVLNELTKAPFEPMKDTDLKHPTLKPAFLLALASGKRRSEIHAWVANKVVVVDQFTPGYRFMPTPKFIQNNHS